MWLEVAAAKGAAGSSPVQRAEGCRSQRRAGDRFTRPAQGPGAFVVAAGWESRVLGLVTSNRSAPGLCVCSASPFWCGERGPEVGFRAERRQFRAVTAPSFSRAGRPLPALAAGGAGGV